MNEQDFIAAARSAGLARALERCTDDLRRAWSGAAALSERLWQIPLAPDHAEPPGEASR